MIHIDAMILALVTGTVIPIVTGIITKLSASSGLKALVSAVLAGAVAVAGYVGEWNGVGTWKQALVVGLVAFMQHAASYYGLLKPTGIAPAIQETTRGFGLGG